MQEQRGKGLWFGLVNFIGLIVPRRLRADVAQRRCVYGRALVTTEKVGGRDDAGHTLRRANAAQT